MTKAPKILWERRRHLSVEERGDITSYRAGLSKRDRYLTDRDIIALFTPEEFNARDTIEGAAVIRSRLRKALKGEISRLAHWTYNFALHRLLIYLIAEISSDMESGRMAI